MSCLNACALGILRSKLRGSLLLSHRMKCFVFLTFLQQQFTRFNFCLGTMRSRRAWATIFARKAYMNGRKLCWIETRAPREALFPSWTGDGLCFPIDLEVLLAETFCGLTLPSRILSHRTKDAHAILGLTAHQSFCISVTSIDQMDCRKQARQERRDGLLIPCAPSARQRLAWSPGDQRGVT
jgi:hypothetical protein